MSLNTIFLFSGSKMYTKVQLYVEDLLFATATAINKKEAKNQVCIKAFRILSTLTSQEIADQVMVIL